VKTSQSARVLELAQEIKQAEAALEAKRQQLRAHLKEAFGCGPRASRSEIIRQLIEIFVFGRL
jgi:hypothetical protein